MIRKHTFRANFAFLDARSAKLHFVRSSRRNFADSVLVWTSCDTKRQDG